jgi:hypothetical protein
MFQEFLHLCFTIISLQFQNVPITVYAYNPRCLAVFEAFTASDRCAARPNFFVRTSDLALTSLTERDGSHWDLTVDYILWDVEAFPSHVNNFWAVCASALCF